MNSVLRTKSKNSALTKVLSDQTLPKQKKKKLISNRSDGLVSRDSKNCYTLQDSKLIHHINLQIPSTNSPNLSNSLNKKKQTKKVAVLKGYTSKVGLKSPKNPTKTKKNPKDAATEAADKERPSLEKGAKKLKAIELELKKALEENKKLKRIIQDEKQNDESVEDLMKGFKSRLYKFLYE